MTNAVAARTPSRGKPDQVCADAVDLARAAVTEDVAGPHMEVVAEGERLVTHYFECLMPGYRGWRWAVTVARTPRSRQVTVCETVLLPGPDALTTPEWVPWEERIQAGDLGIGDLMPTAPDDDRLVPGYLLSDDPATEDVVWELGLGRVRVLSRDGRLDTAERWYEGDHGPHAAIASAAPATARCVSCGFYLPLAGSMRALFGVCANVYAPDDGRVVSADHGCGAHSEIVIEPTVEVDEAPTVYDDAGVVALPDLAAALEPESATPQPESEPQAKQSEPQLVVEPESGTEQAVEPVAEAAPEPSDEEASRQGTAAQEQADQEQAAQAPAAQGPIERESAAQEPIEREQAAQQMAAQEAVDQELADREPAGQEAANQEAAAQEAVDQEAADREPAGQESAGQEPAGQESAGQESAGQESANQEAVGQELSQSAPEVAAAMEAEPAETASRPDAARESEPNADVPATEAAMEAGVAHAEEVWTTDEPADETDAGESEADAPGSHGPDADAVGAVEPDSDGPDAQEPDADAVGAVEPDSDGVDTATVGPDSDAGGRDSEAGGRDSDAGGSAPDAGGTEAHTPDAGGPDAGGPDSDGPGSDGPGSDGPGSDGPGSDGPGSDGPGSDGLEEDVAAETAATEAYLEQDEAAIEPEERRD